MEQDPIVVPVEVEVHGLEKAKANQKVGEIMGRTKIQWCDEVYNGVTGCTNISPGCKNCYAKKMAYRLRGRCGYDMINPFKPTLHMDKIEKLSDLDDGPPKRIFVSSMGDLFHDAVPDEWIDRVLGAARNSRPNELTKHTFMVLTKRPERMQKWCVRNTTRGFLPYPNFWIGVTAENQEMADRRIPVLKGIPAAVRWVSVEPMLEAVDLERWLADGTLDWVVVGPETGTGKRPCENGWIWNLYHQCHKYKVPFFDKRKIWKPLAHQFPTTKEEW